jgi:hypothetical protein
MKVKLMLIQMILLQIAPHIHPVWSNVFFYLFIALMFSTSILAAIMMKVQRKKNAEIKLMQQQHVSKVDLIRKDHGDTLEKIRIEMLKREEERTRQWMESEKETLHVLNGVSILLDISEKIGIAESEKILKVLDIIYGKVENLTELGNNLQAIAIIKERVEILGIIKEKVEVLDVIKEKIEKLSLPE